MESTGINWGMVQALAVVIVPTALAVITLIVSLIVWEFKRVHRRIDKYEGKIDRLSTGFNEHMGESVGIKASLSNLEKNWEKHNSNGGGHVR